MGRVISVVTVGRSDFGILTPVIRAIEEDPELVPSLLVTGSHLSREHGYTVTDIEASDFPIGDQIEMLLSADSPTGIAKSVGVGVLGFAESFRSVKPDILLVLGDRFETLTAVVASLPFNIPVAHIHGGEATEGLIDEAIRHAITKMSHLHFVATDAYAKRVIQMGEEPWRVTVSGAPSLDDLEADQHVSTADLEEHLDMRLDTPPILVTFHPVTLDFERSGVHVDSLLRALDAFDLPVVMTSPNADTANRSIQRALEGYASSRPNACLCAALGRHRYFALMRRAAAMVGNSSSGIIEAASFELPVVNIGERQRGRLRPPNVIDVGNETESIVRGLSRALDPVFRAELAGMTNPYGDGRAGHRIVSVLKSVTLGSELIMKRFKDMDV